MKNKISNYALLLVFTFISGIARTQNLCDFIQRVQAYQKTVKLTSVGEYNQNDIIDTSTFNLKKYLNYFDKLSIQDSMKIDVYYFDNFLDGNPYLYAIKRDQELENVVGISTDKKRTPKERNLLFDFFNDSISKAKNHIIPQDSEYGFFQYLFFSEMGEQFALKWHANYGEKYIICSSKMINQFIKEYSKNARFSVDSVSLKKLKYISPEPIIKVRDDYYEITWIENRTHRGIFKCTYQLERKAPYKIKKVKAVELIEIIPNFMY